MDSIKADHGFNMDSPSVRNLLQTMSEFDLQQRRGFLQFVTGSPKLPIGGKFTPRAALKTKLTRCRLQESDADIYGCVSPQRTTVLAGRLSSQRDDLRELPEAAGLQLGGCSSSAAYRCHEGGARSFPPFIIFLLLYLLDLPPLLNTFFLCTFLFFFLSCQDNAMQHWAVKVANNNIFRRV